MLSVSSQQQGNNGFTYKIQWGLFFFFPKIHVRSKARTSLAVPGDTGLLLGKGAKILQAT